MLAAIIACGFASVMMTSCSDTFGQADNSYREDDPVPENPETPEQQEFWAKFDAWQTDSCTLGDDFFMHMLGTWWKNPVDIYPDGMIDYSVELNNQRRLTSSSASSDLRHLTKNIGEASSITDEELLAILNARMEEIWGGPFTGEETYEDALAALGRSIAAGYGMVIEPVVVTPEGRPEWQWSLWFPTYFSREDLSGGISQVAERLMAPHKGIKQSELNHRLKSRGGVTDPMEIIVGAMDLGLTAEDIEWESEETADYFAEIMSALETPKAIYDFIYESIQSLDGSLVSEDILAEYVLDCSMLMSKLLEKPVALEMDKKKLCDNLFECYGNLYIVHAYNKSFITPQMKSEYQKWCEEFRSVMRQHLETNEWLSGETRENALKKLDAILFNVGEPDVIPACVMPELTGKNIIEDVRQLRKARIDGYKWAIDKTRADVCWLLLFLHYNISYADVNASYQHSSNAVFINPCNLLDPYIQKDDQPALTWAVLASTIGHELTHAFDKEGSGYDLYGVETNWWTEADKKRFEDLCDQLVDQYSNLLLMPWVDPTLLCNGEKTLSENIADLGGCCLGLDILKQKNQGLSDDAMKVLVRRYFQGWAIAWSKSYDLELAKYLKETDVHSLARERTNGVVSNVDAWYDAFNITSGKLYRAPDKRVRIW